MPIPSKHPQTSTHPRPAAIAPLPTFLRFKLNSPIQKISFNNHESQWDHHSTHLASSDGTAGRLFPQSSDTFGNLTHPQWGIWWDFYIFPKVCSFFFKWDTPEPPWMNVSQIIFILFILFMGGFKMSCIHSPQISRNMASTTIYHHGNQYEITTKSPTLNNDSTISPLKSLNPINHHHKSPLNPTINPLSFPYKSLKHPVKSPLNHRKITTKSHEITIDHMYHQ